MKIPDSFKAVQRQVFQDKAIQHRPAVKQTGSLGSVTVVPGSISSSYDCNFQLLSDALVAQEWGLVVARDAKVTSSDPLPIAVGDYVQFRGKVYKVIGHPVYDSHDELILQFQQGAVTVFRDIPQPPYKQGDLWHMPELTVDYWLNCGLTVDQVMALGFTVDERMGGHSYVCVNSRASGSFNRADWKLTGTTDKTSAKLLEAI